LELYCYFLEVRAACFDERDYAYKIAIGTQMFLCLSVNSMTDQTYSEAYYKGFIRLFILPFSVTAADTHVANV
jgi:hypothetical protein